MANLETLELTISSNAEVATQGIDKLTRHLSALCDAVGKSVSGLKKLNAELKTLKGYGALKLPNLGKITGASKAVAKAKNVGVYDPLTNNNRVAVNKGDPNAVPDNVWQAKFQQNNAAYLAQREQTRIATEAARERIAAEAKAAKEYAAEQQKASEALIKQEREAMEQRGDIAKTIIENASSADLLKLKYDSLKQATIDDARAGKLSNEQLVQRTFQLRKLEEEMQNSTESTKETTSALGKIKEGFKSLTSGLSSMWGKITRIATSMLIRKAIRALISSMKEGVNNVYEWSKTVGHDFAGAMDKAKSGALTLKNSLGAMLSPVISALIPIFNSLTSAIITAVNWINQFISLLSGKSSWVRATEQAVEGTDALAESAHGAGGAAKEMLAAFDELNVLSQSGGGGGGGAASALETDYSGMFEEITQFEEKIRSITDFLKNNLESIRSMAIAVGSAILAWKFGNAFLDVLPTLSTLFGFVSTGAVIAVTLQATWLLTGQYLDTGEEGWLFASALATAVGTTAAAAIASKLIGGQAGTYTAGITLILSAATDVIANLQHTDVSALSKESILTNAKAALEAATGIGFIAHATGASLAGTITAAAGGGLLTFGVAMGIKTIFDKTNVEWDSKESIIGAVTSALPVGLGLFALGVGIVPASIAALATFGLVLAAKAMIPKSKITWGNIELSEEDVQAYVGERMFNVDVPATINVITEHVDISSQQRNKIEHDMIEMLDTFNIIKLGMADNQDYALLHSQVDAIIDDINKYVDLAKKTGRMILEYTPTLAGSNEVEQGEWFTNYNQGWTEIEEFVKGKGSLIGKWLTEQESKEIKDAVPDVVSAAMEQLNAVTEAITQAQIEAEAFSGFQLSLGDINENSFNEVITKFNKYKDELTQAYSDLVSEQYSNQAQLVKALKIVLGDDFENDPTYQKALADLEYMGKNMAQAVEDGVNSAIEPGKTIVSDWLDKQFGGTVDYGEDFWYDLFERQGLTGADLPDVLKTVLEQNMTQEQIDLATMVGFSGWDALADTMKQGLFDMLGEIDATKVEWLQTANIPISDILKFSGYRDLEQAEQQNMISAILNAFGSSSIAEIKQLLPGISADSIIKLTNWSSFTDTQKTAFVKAIGDSYGSEAAKKAAKAAGINVVDEVQNGANSKTPKITATVAVKEGSTDAITKEIAADVKPTVYATPKSTATAKNNLKNDIHNNVKPTVYATPLASKTAKTNLKNDIHNNVTPTVYATPYATKTAKTNLKKDIHDNVTPTVTTNLASTKAQKNAFKAAIKTGVIPSVNPKLVSTTTQKNDYKSGLKTGVIPIINPKLASTKTQKNDFTTNIHNNVIPIINPDLLATNDSKTALKRNVEGGVKPQVYSSLHVTNTAKTNLTWDIESGVNPTVYSSLNVSSSEKTNLKSDIESISPNIQASVTATGLEALGRKIKKSIDGTITLKSSGETVGKVTIAAAANGGIFDNGQLFIAREAGAEMVGSMNGKTTVANNDQIISGIENGVRNAQAEQNRLLAEQNSLLAAILQKTGSGGIPGASSALGRIVSQSLSMYNGMVGG